LQNGTGYQVTNADAKNTQRQFYSDWEYTGGANQADAGGNQQSYDSAYNMRQNMNKEIIAEGRAPTTTNVKLGSGKDQINMQIKKLQQDRYNQRSAMPAPTHPNARKAMDTCELTSFKNNLPTYNSYFDPTLTQTFDTNPLTQSLKSYA
jgi:hypothetical protein